jgi:RNA polymerase sigma-70 factor (family 1)
MIAKDNVISDEQQCVERIKAGDEKAFRKIYDYYHSRLYYFSLRFVGTEEGAKEIVQEAFVKLWTHRQRINSDFSLQGYLYTIARHLNYKTLQQTARDLALREELVYRRADQYAQCDDEAIYNDYLKIAEDAVEQLSPHRRLVYRMSWKQGLSPHEISRDLNISVSTVKNHLVEARKKIKEHLVLNADLSVTLLFLLQVSTLS